jgi:hypothetical protein
MAVIVRQLARGRPEFQVQDLAFAGLSLYYFEFLSKWLPSISEGVMPFTAEPFLGFPVETLL